VQWLAVGDVAMASRWAKECGGGSEREQITLARLRLAQGRADDAQRLLAQQRLLAEAGGRNGRLIEILGLQAIALKAQGQTSEAAATLSQAHFLAEPEGYKRLFLDMERPSPPAEALLSPLTERELEALRLLAEGLSNKEIAEQLIVAPSTVKQHLKNIYSKLDVHSRTQAVARGQELNLL
jgi:LuxR family maltose regulon positive regulatory protein